MKYQKNGKIIHQDVVSIEDRAFLYGDGCFTTARLSSGNIILWQRHLQRMEYACQQLRLNCDIERIKNEKELFLQHLPQQSGIVKIVISRGIGQRGYAMPIQAADVYFYYYPSNATHHLPIIQQVGIMPESLGSIMPLLRGVKSLNRLEQVVLKDIAIQQQWDEALCFDQRQHLVEAISSNCFVYINGFWVTPDLALAGIQGVMRQEILQRLQHYQIPHQVRIISINEISQIRAGFLCNALQPMQIIHNLSNHVLDIKLCEQLFNRLFLTELV